MRVGRWFDEEVEALAAYYHQVSVDRRWLVGNA